MNTRLILSSSQLTPNLTPLKVSQSSVTLLGGEWDYPNMIPQTLQKSQISQGGRPQRTLTVPQITTTLLPTGVAHARTELPPPQQTRLSILRHLWKYSQSAPKSTVSSQDWEVTELTHRGRNAFLRTAKKEIRGKSQELLYHEKLYLFFWKSTQITQRKNGSFHRQETKKRSESKAVSEVMMLKFDFNQFGIL